MVIKMLNYTNIELVRTAGLSEQIPRDGIPQIALSGRLRTSSERAASPIRYRTERASRASPVPPGKTITLNFYLVDKKPDTESICRATGSLR